MRHLKTLLWLGCLALLLVAAGLTVRAEGG